MKTTQLTSKVLVAALLLSVVSPVLANPTEEGFFSKNWKRAKNFIMPVRYTAGQKENALAQFPESEQELKQMQEFVKAEKEALEQLKKDNTAAVDVIKNDAGKTAEVRAKEVEELEKTQTAKFAKKEAALKSDEVSLKESEDLFKSNKTMNSLRKFNINHPNYVKYGAMSAAVAAITALGALAYKYELPQKALNKIKSVFGFGKKQVLDAITTDAQELVKAITEGQEVKVTLNATLEKEAVKAALESVKVATLVNDVKTAVKNFDAKLEAAKTAKAEAKNTAVEALSKTQEALDKAVKAANEELKKQEEKNSDKTSSSNTEATTEETKKEDKATVAKTAVKKAVPAPVMGQARTTRR